MFTDAAIIISMCLTENKWFISFTKRRGGADYTTTARSMIGLVVNQCMSYWKQYDLLISQNGQRYWCIYGTWRKNYKNKIF